MENDFLFRRESAYDGCMWLLIPPALPWPVVALLAMVVLAAAASDLKRRKIPNGLALGGVMLGLALNAKLGGWGGLRASAWGLAVGFGLYFGLYLLHAMGAGDVKLMGAVGAVAGWQAWISIFLATSIAGAVLGLIVAASKGRLRQTLWNTGYLAKELLSFRAPWLTHEHLDVKHPDTLRLPHGVAIAVGSLTVAALSRAQG
jgi:prepilin peptidase CpaA